MNSAQGCLLFLYPPLCSITFAIPVIACICSNHHVDLDESLTEVRLAGLGAVPRLRRTATQRACRVDVTVISTNECTASLTRFKESGDGDPLPCRCCAAPRGDGAGPTRSRTRASCGSVFLRANAHETNTGVRSAMPGAFLGGGSVAHRWYVMCRTEQAGSRWRDGEQSELLES